MEMEIITNHQDLGMRIGANAGGRSLPFMCAATSSKASLTSEDWKNEHISMEFKKMYDCVLCVHVFIAHQLLINQFELHNSFYNNICIVCIIYALYK